MIFDVQRFSLHDGPGIRTVVFFKGCPLACPWCENPESQSAAAQLVCDERLCIGCLECVRVAQPRLLHALLKTPADRYMNLAMETSLRRAGAGANSGLVGAASLATGET